jgi:ribosome biogenesis GTPase A
VLTRRELILLLTELPPKLHLVPQDRHQGRICVGMLGYPNVGKSSAINTILAVSKSSHGKPVIILNTFIHWCIWVMSFATKL